MMNTKSAVTPHPRYEQLFGYATNTIHKDDIIASHLDHCTECQQEIEVIREMSTLLASHKQNIPQYFTDKHLSDEEINEYVYERVDDEKRKKIDLHLTECSTCLKEVLSFRTLLAERQNSITSNPLTVPRKKTSLKLMQFASLAIAASLALFSFFYLFPDSTNHSNPEVIAKKTEQETGFPQDITAKTHSSENLMPVTNQGRGQIYTNNGIVNWYGAYIETEAIGTVDMAKMTNPVQAEILAEKTARANGYAQISEILGGVQITQKSSYKDMLMQADYLNVENQSFIRNAKVINKTIEWINDVPKVTIKMRVPLYGNNSVQSIVAPHIPKSKPNPAMRTNDNKSRNSLQQYTGFVIDTRNSNYQPAMHVNLNTSSTTDANGAYALEYLTAQYYAELTSANVKQNTGENPYVIRASKESDTGLIMLDQRDMNKIADFLSQQNLNKPLAILY